MGQKNQSSNKTTNMKKKTSPILILAIGIALVCWQRWKTPGNEETQQPTPTATTNQQPASDNSKPSRSNPTAAPAIHYEIPRYENGMAPSEQLLKRTAYTASYNQKTRNPNWVGWVLTAEHTDGPYERKGIKFEEDEEVPAPRARYSDIRESECGYQRGHLCPAADNKWSFKTQKEAFLMTNICPQNGDLNQRDWKYLEQDCREWALKYGKIYIVAGPIFNKKRPKTVGENKVAVPDAFFKVVLMVPESGGKDAKAAGFVYDNKEGHHPASHYQKTIDEVERMTHLDFFHQLDDQIENDIESRHMSL